MIYISSCRSGSSPTASALKATGTFMPREPDSFPTDCSACSIGQAGRLLRWLHRRLRRARAFASTLEPVCAGCGGDWSTRGLFDLASVKHSFKYTFQNSIGFTPVSYTHLRA